MENPYGESDQSGHNSIFDVKLRFALIAFFCSAILIKKKRTAYWPLFRKRLKSQNNEQNLKAENCQNVKITCNQKISIELESGQLRNWRIVALRKLQV